MIYLASPFFDEKELETVSRAEGILRDRGYEVYSPREHEYREAETGTPAWSAGIFKEDVEAINACDVVVMLYHGNYSDSGTAWEAGYAFGTGKPVVAVQLGDLSNIMVHESARANITMEELAVYDFEEMPRIGYKGKMT